MLSNEDPEQPKKKKKKRWTPSKVQCISTLSTVCSQGHSITSACFCQKCIPLIPSWENIKLKLRGYAKYCWLILIPSIEIMKDKERLRPRHRWEESSSYNVGFWIESWDGEESLGERLWNLNEVSGLVDVNVNFLVLLIVLCWYTLWTLGKAEWKVCMNS